ncbi:TlpA family protein disulfide reductase [bacterium]|nr:TlpA family protein disulfide reductase [bacterium]
MTMKLNCPAPDLKISEWVQGNPTNISDHRGNVILVEVFQVNCPGCFLYGLPEAIEAFTKYRDEPFTVLGLATAFEDFDKNNLDNLKKLLETGEVVGETLSTLKKRAWLDDNKLRYKIPFPVAMDNLVSHDAEHVDQKVIKIIEHEIPKFERFSYGEQMRIRTRIRDYVLQQEYTAETFENYVMNGTPTSLLIDKKGILRHQLFGTTGKLDKLVNQLLTE